MCKLLNKWLNDNNLTLLLHSTSMDNVGSIFNNGLQFVSDYSFDTSRRDIIKNCSVTEQELDLLEEAAIKNPGTKMHLSKSFETSILNKTTVFALANISGNATIVLCVPKKSGKLLKELTEFEEGVVTNPYVIKKIYCSYDEDEWSDDGKYEIEFSSVYYYPIKAILFAFDRDNIKIKINNGYDEKLYLDDTTPQSLFVNPGEIVDMMKNIDNYSIVSKSK